MYEWAFVGPVATLYSAERKTVGEYCAGPTWEAADGAKVTGKQVAVARAMACELTSTGKRQQVACEADCVSTVPERGSARPAV